MQLLTYTNLAGETVIFGGSPPFILEHIEGTESADIDRKTYRGANQDGERTVSAFRADRRLDVTFHLLAFGRNDLYRARADELCGVLSAEKAFNRETMERARVVYRNDHGEWWTWAVPSGAPRFAKRVKDIHPSMKISFACDSPFWFGMSEEKGGFEVGETAFQLPLRFPIRFASRAAETVLINRGHSRAPVRIVLRGEGEKPSIINKTTGQRIALTSPLQTGSLLEINTDPTGLYARMEYEGETVNAYGLLDVTTPISEFTLAPGANVIAYEAGGGAAKTSVSIHWRNQYEGV